ncbi:MAG: ABC transporter permease [Anaerolineae bacterium]
MADLTANQQAGQDERLKSETIFRRLLRRPELAAVAGTIIVWIIFAVIAGNRGFLTLRGTANYLEVSAEIGIMAVAVSLLMIAGQFDLSIGSVIGAGGMIIAILTVQYGWNIWAAILASLITCLAIGFINGYLVVRTKLPSFIITLASLFIVRGMTIGLTRLITGRTQVGGLRDVLGYNSAFGVFASGLNIPTPENPNVFAEFPISIFWWLLIAGLATYLLLRTRVGNWIFGIGGDENAARNVGVPVNRIKVLLFMLIKLASAWLVATIQGISVGSADTLRGQYREFYAIIVAVIGGTLLTGGYGSALGAVFGALILGMVQQGIIFAGIDLIGFSPFSAHVGSARCWSTITSVRQFPSRSEVMAIYVLELIPFARVAEGTIGHPSNPLSL